MRSSARRLDHFRLLLIACCLAASAAHAEKPSWTAPLGVPVPAFGIREEAPAPPKEWTNETPGFYYVDNTSANATDDVGYGTPERPRRSIPTSVPAGSVVEVRGGPYRVITSTSIGGPGTASAPIFYRGVGSPEIAGALNKRILSVSGSHVIVEGITFVNLQVTLGGSFQAIRDCELRGITPARGGSAIYAPGKNLVVLRNHIHDNGTLKSNVENDIHGVLVGVGAERVWIVDNDMHGNGGDSVQVNSGNGKLARLIYIARNKLHEEGENAVDIKTAEDVIVSQNTCWGFRPTNFVYSGSDGTAIVINDDNARNKRDNHIWVIFNQVSNASVGVRAQSYVAVMGNVFRGIKNAAVLSFGPHDVHIEHNTMVDVGRALERFGGGPTNRVVFANNIVSDRTIDDAKVTGNAARTSAIAYSLFPKRAKFVWEKTTFESVREFSGWHPCKECREGNPMFVNSASHDYRLAPGSPAIGMGFGSAAYAMFRKMYSLDIAVDFDGHPRPGKDGKWDVGAFESDGGR